MLIKQLKYDLKWVYSLIVVFYLLALVFAILARLTMFIDESLVFMIINKILSTTSVSMIVSALINIVTRSWIRFTKSVYGDESYLTHTLPISKKCIYLSKVLTSIIVSISTFVVAIICLIFCYYSKGLMDYLNSILENSTLRLDIKVGSLIFFIIILFLGKNQLEKGADID